MGAGRLGAEAQLDPQGASRAGPAPPQRAAALAPEQVAFLVPLWTLALQQAFVAPVSERDGVLYVCARGTLHALEAERGRALWSTGDLGDVECGTPVASEDGVFVTSSGFQPEVSHLSAFDRRTGGLRWRVPSRDPRALGFQDPTPAGDAIYVAELRGGVVALDARTGEERWRAPTGARNSPVAVAGARVLVATDGEGFGLPPRLLALDAQTGSALWQAELDGAIAQHAPVHGKGRVFVSTEAGHVYAFQIATGARLWDRPPKGAWLAAPLALGPGTVYVVTGGDPLITALDAQTGEPRWVHAGSRGEGPSSNLASAHGVLYLTTDSVFDAHRLRTLHGATGALLGGVRPETLTGSYAKLVVVGARLLASTNQGVLHVLGLPASASAR